MAKYGDTVLVAVENITDDEVEERIENDTERVSEAGDENGQPVQELSGQTPERTDGPER